MMLERLIEELPRFFWLLQPDLPRSGGWRHVALSVDRLSGRRIAGFALAFMRLTRAAAGACHGCWPLSTPSSSAASLSW